MNPEFRTVTIARAIAEEEAADAYDALFSEILELREEVEALRREVEVNKRDVQALKRAVLQELERLREALA